MVIAVPGFVWSGATDAEAVVKESYLGNMRTTSAEAVGSGMGRLSSSQVLKFDGFANEFLGFLLRPTGCDDSRQVGKVSTPPSG